jgi:hypothetical protein
VRVVAIRGTNHRGSIGYATNRGTASPCAPSSFGEYSESTRARPRQIDSGTRSVTNSNKHAREHAYTRTLTHTCTRTHARTVTHMHARTHAHLRTHVRAHAHTRTRTHARTHAHLHAQHSRTRNHTHASTITRTHARTHPRAHNHTHTPKHTQSHARTHTCMQVRAESAELGRDWWKLGEVVVQQVGHGAAYRCAVAREYPEYPM